MHLIVHCPPYDQLLSRSEISCRTQDVSICCCTTAEMVLNRALMGFMAVQRQGRLLRCETDGFGKRDSRAESFGRCRGTRHRRSHGHHHHRGAITDLAGDGDGDGVSLSFQSSQSVCCSLFDLTTATAARVFPSTHQRRGAVRVHVDVHVLFADWDYTPAGKHEDH